MNRRAWIAASIGHLNKVNSWTGRTHIHKHLFIAQVLGLADVPFPFELYHFGPYSFEADRVIAEMEAFGEVEKRYSRPGYGPRYSTTPLSDEVLDEKDDEVLSNVAQSLRQFDSTDLELIATCLWVEHREKELDDQIIVDRVKEIKPKYTTFRIETALAQARRVAEELV